MEQEGHPEADEKILALVRDILRTLTKTVKTFNVYPNDNPIYQKFAADLFDKFSTFFESDEELTVEVRQHSLLFKEREVFHSEDRTDNVALLLFADGIRRLSIQKGISREEIIDFIDILRLAQRAETKDEDDIVTLLWERNIKNMSYSAVEDVVDDSLFVEETFAWETIGLDETLETAAAGMQAAASGISSPGTALPSFLGEISPTLSAEEQTAIKDEASGFGEKFLLASAADLFFELLSHENAADAFPDMMVALGRMVDTCVHKRYMQEVLVILKGLRKISASYGSAEQVELIDGVLSRAGNIESLRIVFREVQDTDIIRQHLFLLGKKQIPQMIELLGELQERRQRRLLCEILAEIGKEDPGAFSEAVGDPRWYLVRNVIMVLGMTKTPLSVKYIEKALRHSDVRVRREAVRALDGIPSGETKRLFVSVIRDPDLTVRMAALKALKRSKDPELFHALKGIASVEELRKKTFAEKKEVLEAVAFFGGMDAMPLLTDLFRKKGLMEKEEITEVRAAAAYGLGVMGTPEALALIEKETESRKDVLRDACIKALRESEKNGIDRR